MLNSGLSFTIIFISGIIILVTFYYLIVAIKEIYQKKRKFKGNGIKGILSLIMLLVLLTGFTYCVYNAPYILLNGYSWAMIEEWGPSVFLTAVFSLSFVVPVFFLYFLLTTFFVKPDDKPFFMMVVLSIVSGIGSSLNVFIINEALNRSMSVVSRKSAIESGLYFYFILGIMLFTMSAMVVRKRLITVTANVVYDKRMDIIKKLLGTYYFQFETIESEKIYAALNNDTEVISGFVNMFVNGLTGIVTLISCFFYLGNLNLSGMFLSLIVIFLAVALFLKASQSAEKSFEKNRDIQNLFYKYINDLTKGFKELYINKAKLREFCNDVKTSCELYRDTRVEGEFRFVGVSIMGEIMYISVIGIVVFLFPILFRDIQNNTLRNYVLVYLYMGGIVNSEIFYVIPGLVRVSVSWKRIQSFIKEISLMKNRAAIKDEPKAESPHIELRGVKFQYKNENGERFTIGPINYEFKPGEIIFISGGNGSGKTTLAKLITGLYEPDEGEILVEHQKVDSNTLGSYFTTIFSDFYLFDKLYGIDYTAKQTEIDKYLKTLNIYNKVQLNNGVFSTLKLSTGQKKRLALLISYLEDRPIYLFDEWAADQDPEYRQFFYKVLLPEFKNQGKTVIAITHDERYFSDADGLIKMEMGRIVEQEEMAIAKNEIASA